MYNSYEKFENENIVSLPKIKVIDHPTYGKIKCFDNNDTVCNIILENNVWEKHLHDEVFTKYITDNSTIIDCGTYIGSHTILLSKINPNNDIIGFEMMPEHYKILLDNITMNNLSNVIVFNVALDDKIGHITIPMINYEKENSNFGGTSIYNEKSNIRVPTFTLDYILPFINESKPVKFIKIDIEGHELPCLSGAKQLIEKFKPLILIEIWNDQYEKFTASDIWKHMETLGYKIKNVATHDYLLYVPGIYPDLQ